MKRSLFCFLLFVFSIQGFGWGFYGHRTINRMACFTLPPELFGFYKINIDYLTNHAVDPDKRRMNDPKEAPRHFIDADHYGEHPFDSLPQNWKDAVSKYSEDSLNMYGIGPWYIQKMFYNLIDAFVKKDIGSILYYSANIGHYIADSHVPLHCTENYNGQLTNQQGIHGLWESRLPELFGADYDLFVGRAVYIENIRPFVWQKASESYAALDSVLSIEKKLSSEFEADKKHSFEIRGSTVIQVYSREYSAAYNELLAGQVERRLCSSVIDVGSIWFTAWVNAGMPQLLQEKIPEEKSTEETPDDFH